MRRVVLLFTPFLLAACESPQQRCMSTMSSELRTVAVLVAETEQNLERGFTYINEPTRTRVGINYCAGSGGYWGGSGVRFCGSSYNDVRRRPVAVDPEAEQRKLDDLLVRQEQLLSAMPQAEAACAARYPG